VRPRIVLPTLAAATLLGLGALFVNAPAEVKAQPAPATANPDVIYDEQNVRTDRAGRVRLRFNRGEHNQSCLSGKALYVGVAPARNLDNPGNAPVTFQAVQHQQCEVLLVLLNKDNRPVRNDTVRITYTASAITAFSA
jgi:hypothetical protein